MNRKKKLLKIKLNQQNIYHLEKKKSVLETEIKELEQKTKDLSEKAGTIKDFNLLQKSNELLKVVLEKQSLLKELDNSMEMRPAKKIKR